MRTRTIVTRSAGPRALGGRFLRGIIAACALLAASCGGSRPSTLYEPVGTDRPSLLDGEIRMTTRWSTSPEEIPDVRSIACEQGRITCFVETKGVRREGYASEAEWRDLWARLEPVAPWSQSRFDVKPNDPTGGPYHLVQLRAGSQFSEFSSQHRADILVFTSREASDRLQYSNIIVDFVSRRARTPVVIAPAETQPGEPSKP